MLLPMGILCETTVFVHVACGASLSGENGIVHTGLEGQHGVACSLFWSTN